MTLASTLDCGICRLRPWRSTDQAALLRHANNRAIWRNLRDRFPFPYDATAAAAWLGFAAAEPAPEGVWAIDVGGEAVGGLGIERQPDIARGSGELGYWLGQEVWGRGIATAAVRAASEHALAQPDLWRLFAPVFPWNPASQRVLEKAGFTLEAVHRRAGIKDGTVIDEMLYTRVRDPGLPCAPLPPHLIAMERAVPVLPASDLRVARDFYVERLGFTVRFEATGDGVTGLLGVQRGMLVLTLDCPMDGHGRNACAALEVDSADACYQEWRDRVPEISPPKNEPWGARTFDLLDPFGNTLFVIGPTT